MEMLKKQRTSVKGTITRIFNYCENSDLTDEAFRVRLEKIERYFEQFEQLQIEIENECTTAELTAEEAVRIEIEEKYYAVKALGHRLADANNYDKTVVENVDQSNQMTTAIDTLAKNQSALSTLIERLSSTSKSTAPPSAASVNYNHQNSIQLPRLNLPEFDGNYTDWVRFRDLFNALVHEKTNVSNIEKFEYLMSDVKGDALSLIRHLSLSNDNYIIAWNLIKARYDNSKLIKRNYVKLLFDQPNMKGPSTGELKRLINTTNECIGALQTLDEQVTTQIAQLDTRRSLRDHRV